MKNNTAMEELIEYVTKYEEVLGVTAKIVKEKATALLEKEKRIIVEARATAPVLFGFDDGYCKKEAEQYFTKTFKKD